MSEQITSTLRFTANSYSDIKPIELTINHYKKRLLEYLEDYQISLNEANDSYSKKANDKAKIILASYAFPDNYELEKKSNSINIGRKTREIVRKYLNQTMKILGSICECIIIDNCKRNPEINMKCINYACFKSDINENYSDIDYNQYTPFSPSHKQIVHITPSGIRIPSTKNIYRYEPNHPSKDVIWCNKECLEEILQATIPGTKYLEDAKLQIKTSMNYLNIDWDEDKYRYSPIIYFDILNDYQKLFNYLVKRNSVLQVMSARMIDEELIKESDKYFRLLVAHFAGLQPLDLDESAESEYKGILRYLYSSPTTSLFNDTLIQNQKKALDALQSQIRDYNDIRLNVSIIND